MSEQRISDEQLANRIAHGDTDQGVELSLDLRDARAEIVRLTAERDEARNRSLESQMLAHQWMVAHDMRQAGKPVSFPSPADLPESIARCADLQSRDDALLAERAGVSEAMVEAVTARRKALENSPARSGKACSFKNAQLAAYDEILTALHAAREVRSVRLTPEWCLAMAEIELGREVGAGCGGRSK